MVVRLLLTLPVAWLWWTLTLTARAQSPVLSAPGMGQVGTGLQNAWGLEDDDDDDDEDEEEEEEPEDGDEPEVTILAEKKGNKEKGKSM